MSDPIEHELYEECSAAYQAARDMVFDVYPEGVPPPAELEDDQKHALARLDAAERARDDYRRQRAERLRDA